MFDCCSSTQIKVIIIIKHHSSDERAPHRKKISHRYTIATNLNGNRCRVQRTLPGRTEATENVRIERREEENKSSCPTSTFGRHTNTRWEGIPTQLDKWHIKLSLKQRVNKIYQRENRGRNTLEIGFSTLGKSEQLGDYVVNSLGSYERLGKKAGSRSTERLTRIVLTALVLYFAYIILTHYQDSRSKLKNSF